MAPQPTNNPKKRKSPAAQATGYIKLEFAKLGTIKTEATTIKTAVSCFLYRPKIIISSMPNIDETHTRSKFF